MVEKDIKIIIPYKLSGKLSKKRGEISGNDKKCKQIGHNAKKFSSKFGWDNLSKEDLKIYKKVVRKNGE